MTCVPRSVAMGDWLHHNAIIPPQGCNFQAFGAVHSGHEAGRRSKAPVPGRPKFDLHIRPA